MSKKSATTGSQEVTISGPSQEASTNSDSDNESTMTFERPKRMHYIEAERIRQEREEAILRAVDVAEQQLKLQNERNNNNNNSSNGQNLQDGKSKSRWKFW